MNTHVNIFIKVYRKCIECKKTSYLIPIIFWVRNECKKLLRKTACDGFFCNAFPTITVIIIIIIRGCRSFAMGYKKGFRKLV